MLNRYSVKGIAVLATSLVEAYRIAGEPVYVVRGTPIFEFGRAVAIARHGGWDVQDAHGRAVWRNPALMRDEPIPPTQRCVYAPTVSA